MGRDERNRISRSQTFMTLPDFHKRPNVPRYRRRCFLLFLYPFFSTFVFPPSKYFKITTSKGLCSERFIIFLFVLFLYSFLSVLSFADSRENVSHRFIVAFIQNDKELILVDVIRWYNA